MTALPPIARLVPHAGPMLLLDEVVDHAPGRARCTVRLREDSTFVEAGRVRAVVALEYMAQAAAACAGLQQHDGGRPPGKGVLLGARELTFAVSHLQVGDLLIVDVEQLYGDEHLGSFRCAVRREDQVVAEATLSVYQAEGAGFSPTTGDGP